MLNPLFWKRVQAQKHPGRWGIVEHQIPSIKVLFKTNTKSHKHPGIKLLSSESKTQLVNQRKQKVAFNPGTAHSLEIQSYRMWWGAASPILNDRCNRMFFATIDRCSIMTGMYRRFMMIYSSPHAKFKGTKSNGRIHRYGASIFGDIIINVSKSINEEK